MNSKDLQIKRMALLRGPETSSVPLYMQKYMQKNNRHTKWPQEPTPLYQPSIPSPSRNYGSGLFRRYATGRLDYDWAKALVLEARRKLQKNIPLQEVEALALSAVYPEIEFEGLPKQVVMIKAGLTSLERYILRMKILEENSRVGRSEGYYSGW